MSTRAYQVGQSTPQALGVRAPRVTLLAIDERPASADPILANIFRTMRASTGLPADVIARQLGVPADLLLALEAGQTRVFRTPADAVRTIEAYGRLVAVDVKSIIDRLLPQISDETTPLQRQVPNPPAIAAAGPATEQRLTGAPRPHPPLQPATAIAPPQPLKRARRKPPRSVRWLKRVAWFGTVVIALAAGTVMVAESHPRAASAAVGQLPAGMVRSLRATFRQVTGLFGGRDAGLRWIEVSDPRSRKADRLP